MILDALLGFVFGVFEGLLGLLPSFSFDLNFGGVVGELLGSLNEFVDIKLLMITLGGLIAVFAAVELFFLVVWILKKVHILG